MNCPKCNSEYILKNGRTRSQKQNFKGASQFGKYIKLKVDR
ncbi:transposase-like zinc-binding domain-containing protein [Microcoleus sp. S13_C5]